MLPRNSLWVSFQILDTEHSWSFSRINQSYIIPATETTSLNNPTLFRCSRPIFTVSHILHSTKQSSISPISVLPIRLLPGNHIRYVMHTTMLLCNNTLLFKIRLYNLKVLDFVNKGHISDSTATRMIVAALWNDHMVQHPRKYPS